MSMLRESSGRLSGREILKDTLVRWAEEFTKDSHEYHDLCLIANTLGELNLERVTKHFEFGKLSGVSARIGESLTIRVKNKENEEISIHDGTKTTTHIVGMGGTMALSKIKDLVVLRGASCDTARTNSEKISDKKVGSKMTKDTRRGQVFDGVKKGFKKGVVTSSSKMIADTLAESADFEDREWLVKFVQLAVTAGSAELLAILPDSVTEKVKISAEAKRDASKMLREVAGENMGRNIIDYAAGVMPYFKEVLSDFTAEEIETAGEDLTADAEEEVFEEQVEEIEEPVMA